MTLADQMESDVAGVFLQDEEHAQSVTRTPATGDPVTVTAIWEPNDTRMRSNQPEVEHDTGKSHVWKGRLYVASSVTVADSDQWTIDGETYQTHVVGKNEGGMRSIDLQLKERKQTNRAGVKLL